MNHAHVLWSHPYFSCFLQLRSPFCSLSLATWASDWAGRHALLFALIGWCYSPGAWLYFAFYKCQSVCHGGWARLLIARLDLGFFSSSLFGCWKHVKPHLQPLGRFRSRGRSVKNREVCIIRWIFSISHLGSVYFKVLLLREQQPSLIFSSMRFLFKINDFLVHRMELNLDCVRVYKKY